MNAMTCYAHDLQCKCLRNTGVLQFLRHDACWLQGTPYNLVASDARPNPLGLQQAHHVLLAQRPSDLLAQHLRVTKSQSLHFCARGDLIDTLLANIERTSSSIHPQGLPLARSHDYHICLLLKATSVAVRPYRYASAHKDELEC
jgi:hypothetical protein